MNVFQEFALALSLSDRATTIYTGKKEKKTE